ncbi:unnamed protein product [Amaranthus hypochondriacus]
MEAENQTIIPYPVTMETEKQSIIQNPVTMEDLLQLLWQLNTNKSTTETNQPLNITEKLNHGNYTKWSKIMHLSISGRGRLNHIIASPPSTDAPDYEKWAQCDSMVVSWIIENIESDLQNQFLDYPTASELWKSIETMYSSGPDGLPIFDLMIKANKIQLGTDPIEVYYSKLTMIWKEIDRRQPNPMLCPEDKTIYNRLKQQTRLYQFLAGLDESLDKDRRDLLNTDPLPTIEIAYAAIRRELSLRGIMRLEKPSLDIIEPSGIGSKYAARGQTERPSFRPNFRRDDEKAHLRCTHCGGARHTKEGCFQIVGYPEWWPEWKKKGRSIKKYNGKEDQKKQRVAFFSNGEAKGPTHDDGEAMAAFVTPATAIKETGSSDREDYWAWY